MFSAGSGVGIRESALSYDGGGVIKEIVDERIPFPDNHFDCVVSNQVFEHIPQLEPVIAEISRVLKPGGRFINIFPSRDTIREGHCRVPFAHWFKPGSKTQYHWLRLFRILGFGRGKREKVASDWAHFFCKWLTENTFYKPYMDVERQMLEHFSENDYLEADYLAYRMTSRGYNILARIAVLPGIQSLSRWFCIKYGSHVVMLTKG